MKKIFIILGIIMIAIPNLFSITILDNEKKITISLEELHTREIISFATERNKDGIIKNDAWQGVELKKILVENDITNFEQLKFYSADNYMIRLSRENLEKFNPIIALFRNGEKLNEKKIRLVGKELRDMFWIQGIANITTESTYIKKFPHTIFFAEKIFSSQEMHELKPFKNSNGYDFNELVKNILPTSGNFLLIGRDGVSHIFEYEKYLSEAKLLFVDGEYNLKSVQMPGGMWISNLAAVVLDSKAIVFKNQFENIEEIAELLQIETYPSQVTAKSKEKTQELKTSSSFKNKNWENVNKFVW